MDQNNQSGGVDSGIVMATVYLKSSSGRSLMQAGQKALTNPTPFMPAPETVEQAVVELERLGFTIEGRGATLSISGSVELFEEVFNTRITVEKVADELAQEVGPRIGHIYSSSEPVMPISGLEDIIEGVVLAAPGVPFQ